MKNCLKRLVTGALAGVMVLSLAACGGAPSNVTTDGYKDTLTWGQGADVTSLDPHQGKETPSVQVTGQIFDTLLVTNSTTGELEAQIAESWEQLDDLTYVFHLRKGVKFHDGSEVTSADVKFSLERAINSASVSYIVDFIDTVTADDTYTVTVTTKAPYAPTLRNLSIPFAAIVPKAAVEKDEATFILNPIGSGPYTFVEWAQGDHITLKAFDDYYAGKAATENLMMKVIPEASQRAIALETGEIDLSYGLLVNDIAKVDGNENLTVYETPSLSCYYISMNMNKEPFNNPLVREALTYAIDRQTLMDTINAGSGAAADAIVAPGVFGYYSTGVPEYNPEKAKALLAEAGYPNGFSTSIWVNDNQSRVEMCQAIQGMLQDVGVQCGVEVMEFGSFISRTSAGEHDMGFFGWTTSSGDADYTYYSLAHSSQQGSAGNRSFLADPEVDAMVEQARSSSDEALRLDLYKQIAIKLDTLHNNIPLYYSSVNVGANNKVEGFVIDSNEYHKLDTVKVAG